METELIEIINKAEKLKKQIPLEEFLVKIVPEMWSALSEKYVTVPGVALLMERPNLLSEFKKGFASTKYHGNFAGGLWCHSLLVTLKSIQIFNKIFGNIDKVSISSIITVGLFHDIGKLGFIDSDGSIITPFYIKDPKTNVISHNKQIGMSHAQLSASAYMAMCSKDGIVLNIDEYSAILYHNGAYEEGFMKNVSGTESPLMLSVHWADMFVARMMSI